MPLCWYTVERWTMKWDAVYEVYIMKINCISDFQMIHPYSIYVLSKLNRRKTHFMSSLFPSSTFVYRCENRLEIGYSDINTAWTHSRNASTGNGCRNDASSKPEGKQYGPLNADVHIWNCCIFCIHHNEGKSNKWFDSFFWMGLIAICSWWWENQMTWLHIHHQRMMEISKRKFFDVIIVKFQI